MKKSYLWLGILFLFSVSLNVLAEDSFDELRNITKTSVICEKKQMETEGKVYDIVFKQGIEKGKYGIGTESAKSALSDKVAVVCSSEKGSIKYGQLLVNAINNHNTVNKFSAELIVNTDFAATVKNISDYRGLIFSVSYNSDNRIDFDRYGKDLYDYVKDGGFIFVSDAVRPSQCQWIEKVFRSRFIGEIPSVNNPTDEKAPADMSLGMLQTMRWNSYFPLMTAKEVSEDFTPILYGRNGIPNFVYKNIGRGQIYISTLSNVHGLLNDEYLCEILLPEIGKQNRAEYRMYSDYTDDYPNTINTILGRKGEKSFWHGFISSFPLKYRLTEWTGSYDEKGLYFTVRCEDDNMEEIAAKNFGMCDDNIYTDDSVMVVIAPNAKFPILEMFRFGVNINNAHSCRSRYFESKVKKDKYGWTCDIFIPYSSMNIWKDREWVKAKIDGKLFLPFDFNIIRYAHKEQAMYHWNAIMNPSAPVSNPRLSFNCPAGGFDLQGEIYIEDIDLSKYTVPHISVKKPQKPILGENEFIISSKFQGKEYNIDSYICKVIDITENKTYTAKNGKVKFKFSKKGKHYINAVLYDKENTIIAASLIEECNVN